MTIHTIFCTPLPAAGSEFILPDRENTHLFKVFRASVGDTVEILDGKGGRGVAEVLPGKRLLLKESVITPEPELKLHLFCALPRRARQDELLKALAEIGVWEIHPVICERSVALSEPTSRWEVLMQEACKQSKNPFLPELKAPQTLADALNEVKSRGMSAFFGSVADVQLPENFHNSEVAWFVGPEGGFTPQETALMQTAGVLPLNLGPWVLRLETAAVAGLAVLRKMFGCFLLMFLLCSCGDQDIRKNPLMLKGDKYRREGNWELAEKFYHRLFLQYPDAPQICLTLASINEEELGRPLTALYFYNEYLRRIPAAHPDRESITRYRDRLAARISSPAGDSEKLISENKSLKFQLNGLRKLLVTQKKRIEELEKSLTDRKNPPPQIKTTPAVSAEYTVKSGDSLSRIARQHGCSVEALRQKNRLAPGAVLRIGQKLLIPGK